MHLTPISHSLFHFCPNLARLAHYVQLVGQHLITCLQQDKLICPCVFKSLFHSAQKKKQTKKNISFIARPSLSFALHLFLDHVAVNLAFLHLSMSVSMLTVTVFHAGVSGIWSYLIIEYLYFHIAVAAWCGIRQFHTCQQRKIQEDFDA